MKAIASPVRPLSKLLVTLGLGLACMAASSAAADLRGFRGISWGDSTASLGPSLLVQDLGGVACYRRARENLWFGEVELQDVRYCFRDGQMFMVEIDALSDLAALQAEFERGYGAPDWRSAGQATWLGRTRVELNGLDERASLRIVAAEIDAF